MPHDHDRTFSDANEEKKPMTTETTTTTDPAAETEQHLATLAHKEGLRPGGAEPSHQVPDDLQGSAKSGLELEQAPTDLRDAIAAVIDRHEVVWVDHDTGWECGCNEHGDCTLMPTRADAVHHIADAVLPVIQSRVSEAEATAGRDRIDAFQMSQALATIDAENERLRLALATARARGGTATPDDIKLLAERIEAEVADYGGDLADRSAAIDDDLIRVVTKHLTVWSEYGEGNSPVSGDLRESLFQALGEEYGGNVNDLRRAADDLAAVIQAHVAAAVQQARAAAEVAIDDVDSHQQDPERPVPADWRAGWHGACTAMRAALAEHAPGDDEPEEVTELRRAFEAAIRSGGPLPHLSTEHPDRIREQARAEAIDDMRAVRATAYRQAADDIDIEYSGQAEREAAELLRQRAASIAAGGEQRG